MTHVYRWGKYHPELKGRLCRVLARSRGGFRTKTGRRSSWNMLLIEFEDGTRVVGSGNAIKRLKP